MNPTENKRRLAAIMFADVAGYTAMMQRNEKEGFVKVQRFQSVVEEEVSAHQGEMLEVRGDGCMVVFDSAVQAMYAAKAIQEQLQQEPIVPLRIGIHIGDIIFANGSIYGDGVNLASRVESMGVPGSVLVTERVIHDIKSHPEFEMNSLGKFQFKNVEKPMEVFALANEGLAVPKVGEMKGKGEKVKTKNPIVFLVGIGVTVMMMGAGLFWGIGTLGNEQKLLSKEIRDEKVAVNVFENFTGDENLDALGYLGSEWISSGLRELKVRTVSPEMVRQHKERIGILPNNPKNEPSFAEITGAKYLITGSYFLQKDSIILNTRLSSTETGEEIYNFPKLVGHKAQKEALVEEARQYLLGYWELKSKQKLPNISPPKYEAYQIYLNCGVVDLDCYQEVVAIDPNFILARIHLAYTSSIWGMDSIYMVHKSLIEERWDDFTEFEKNFFLFTTYQYDGKMEAAFKALDTNYYLDSNDLKIVQESAFIASARLNRVDIGIQRYEHIFDDMELFDDQIWALSIGHYMGLLNRMDAHEKAVEFYHDLPDNLKENGAYEFMTALLYQEKVEELKKFIADRGHNWQDYQSAAYLYQYLLPEASENPFLQSLEIQIDKLSDLPESISLYRSIALFYRSRNSKFLFYYLKRDWKKAEEALLKLSTFDWEGHYEVFNVPKAWQNQEKLWLASAFGCVYAHQGKVEKSYAQIQLLEELGPIYGEDTIPIIKGGTEYLIARIYAVLGEKEKAIEALRTSIEKGRAYWGGNIYQDIDFVNLKGYAPFEELIRPKD